MNTNSTILWRYLDSIDSTRYSRNQFFYGNTIVPAENTRNLEQARIEICVTILMGHGIIVPNNQLIDSHGFLRIASDMIKAATQDTSKGGKQVYVPLKYAIYATTGPDNKRTYNPYEASAQMFERVKERDDYFELSAWPDLDLDSDRRRQWARALRNNEDIPSNDINHSEAELAEDLRRVLQHFSLKSQDRRENVILAGGTGSFQDWLKAIAELSEQDLESNPFFTRMPLATSLSNADERNKNIMDIANAIQLVTKDIKVYAKEAGIDPNKILNRTRIRKFLRQNPEKYFDSAPKAACLGTLKTIDSIQNLMYYKATGAEQVNQTEAMAKDNIFGFDEAAFALGQWARKNGPITSSNRISSNNNLIITENDSPILSKSDWEIDPFWKSFFECQRESEFKKSMEAYITNLEKLKIDKSVSQLESYRKARETHIDVIKKFLSGLGKEYKIEQNEEKAIFECFDSRIEIEDFAENAGMTKEQKDAIYAGEVANDISAKGHIADHSKEEK